MRRNPGIDRLRYLFFLFYESSLGASSFGDDTFFLTVISSTDCYFFLVSSPKRFSPRPDIRRAKLSTECPRGAIKGRVPFSCGGVPTEKWYRYLSITPEIRTTKVIIVPFHLFSKLRDIVVYIFFFYNFLFLNNYYQKLGDKKENTIQSFFILSYHIFVFFSVHKKKNTIIFKKKYNKKKYIQ